MQDMAQKFKISSTALIQAVSDEMVILDVDSGQYYTLNQTASDMLNLIKQDLTLTEVTEKICQEYDVSISEASADLAQMLETLLEKRLVLPAE